MPIATHLLLDPTLPEAIRSYFRNRAESGSPSFKCLEMGDCLDRREWLSETAKSIGLSAIIALANEEDVGYLESAKVRHSQVSQGANGWFLTQFPEAVPLPPAKPASLWDTHGQPLIPDPTFNPRRRSYHGQPEQEPIPSFGEAGAIRSYRFTDWLGQKGGDCQWLGDASKVRLALASLLDVARNKPATATYLWKVGSRFFTLGPRTAAIETIAGHHQVDEPTAALAVLRRAIGSLNPWKRESWEPIRAEVEAACGLDLTPVLNPQRPDLPRLLELKFPGTERTRLVSNSPALEEPRRFLEELATRDVQSDRPGDAFLFLAMSEAPLRWEPKPPDGLSHVIYANLGAGHLVEVAAYRFKGEAAGPLIDTTDRGYSSNPFLFDGGDVRVQIARLTSDLLEGTSLMAKKKRDAAAAAAQEYD